MKSFHSTDVDAAAAWGSISPAFEMLEGRLLLSGSAPTFATALPSNYVITPGSGITIGVDGADADGDALKITETLWNTATNSPATNANLTIAATSATDQYAILHFTGIHFLNADGSVTIGDGDIVAQIFNKEAPAAATRFITLATKYVTPTGTLKTPTAADPAYYTDVNVHRVIDEFMIQTGDATNGDGTGDSPLKNFGSSDGSGAAAGMTFDAPGVLAFANSSDPSTSNSQFFITSAAYGLSPTSYYIFGQVISGWNVLDAIDQVSTSGGSDGTVYEPPKLQSVKIVSSKQDGVFTISAGSAFTGTADVKVTLDDGHGNTTSQIIHLTNSGDPSVTETATITMPTDTDDDPITTITCLPGNTVTFQPTIADATHVWDRVYDIEAANALGSGSRATVSLDPDTYELTITVPQDYPYAHFIVRILAQNEGYGQDNVTPVNQELDVWVTGAAPTITAPSSTVTVLPGAQTSFALTMTDTTVINGQPVSLVGSIQSVYPAMAGVASIDQATNTVTITVPNDIDVSWIYVTIAAEVAGYTHPEPGTTTVYVSTAGSAPVIANVPDFVDVVPGAKFAGITATITDDNTPGRALLYTITSSNAAVHPVLVANPTDSTQKTISFTAPKTATGMFTVTVTAVEAGFTDRTPTSETVYVYCQNPGDPAIQGKVAATSGGQAMGTFQVGNLLYVADATNGLAIYDITDPANPVQEGTYSTTGEAWSVVVTPNRMVNGVAKTVAFVATLNSQDQSTGAEVVQGTVVLDVTDPTNITLLTTLAPKAADATAGTPAGNNVSICVQGDTLYQLDWQGGMKIWNIADCGNTTSEDGTTTTTNITLVDTFDEFNYYNSTGTQETYDIQYAGAIAMAPDGKHAFMTDVAGYFFVLDMTNPASPEFVTAFGTGGRPWDLKLNTAGTTLYVIDQSTGLIAVNVTNPASPELLGYSSITNMAWSKLVVDGNLIAVSTDTGYTFVDATQFQNVTTTTKKVTLAGSYVLNAPSSGGQASILNGQLALPFAGDGVAVVDASNLLDAAVVATRRAFTLANGHTVTVSIVGAGDARVHFSTDGNTITRLEIVGTTSASSVSITTKGGDVPITDIEIDGSLNSLTGLTTDLQGDLTASGVVASVTLHSVLTATHLLDFNTSLGAVKATDKLTLSLGSVADASINTNGEPIAALAVSQWVDTDDNDSITAPWIGRLTSTGAGAASGDFAASLTLSGSGLAATGLALGSAAIAGNVTGGLWNIDKGVGAVSIASSAAGWTFDAEGGVASLDATGTAGLAGTLSGAYFGRISTKGNLTASIAATSSDPKKDTSIGTLSAAVVDDLALDLPGGIGSINVVEWANTGGPGEIVTAAWIGSLTTTGRAANAAKGLDARAGDFDPALTLTGVGAPAKQPTLGTVRIAGALSDAAWSVTGDAGAITVGGAINGWTATATGDLKSLTADRIQNAAVTADALGAVKAWSWEAGSLTANSVASLTITGYKGVGLLGVGAVAGNFDAQVTVHGLDLKANESAMGASSIAGNVSGSDWLIQNGTMAAMTVGGTVQDSTIRSAAGSMLGLTMGAAVGSTFEAGLSDAGALKDLADVVAGDVAATATIKSLTIRGWKVAAGQPVPTFLSGSTFLAGAFGTISLMNADTDASGIYLLTTTGIKSVKYTDSANPVNNWTWKPTDSSEPAGWTALKHLISA